MWLNWQNSFWVLFPTSPIQTPSCSNLPHKAWGSPATPSRLPQLFARAMQVTPTHSPGVPLWRGRAPAPVHWEQPQVLDGSCAGCSQEVAGKAGLARSAVQGKVEGRVGLGAKPGTGVDTGASPARRYWGSTTASGPRCGAPAAWRPAGGWGCFCPGSPTVPAEAGARAARVRVWLVQGLPCGARKASRRGCFCPASPIAPSEARAGAAAHATCLIESTGGLNIIHGPYFACPCLSAPNSC